ncbi:Nucleotide-sugar transporter [Pleurotus pulmonarius]
MTQHSNNALPAISLNISLKANEAHDQDNDELGLANNTNGNAQAVPSLWGIPLKYISLVTLALQNSLLTIIMHYSRVSTPPSRAYSAATAVLMNELLKGSISLLIAFSRIELPSIPQASYKDISQTTSYPASWFAPRLVSARIRRLWKDVFSADCWKLSIPAILYVIQNNLQYVAASNLDAATFQVSYQMKILTTAGFSVLLLRKRLAPTQWLALLFLAIGVGIVQIQGSTSHSAVIINDMNAMKGFLAVAAACFTSGLAGVYFEMVLKNSQADLWVRNVQLSLFSLLPAIAPILYDHGSEGFSAFSTLFRNFGFWAWATVLVQVLGGLITAMVIKYSDNILKGFATSLSIVISFLASVALFNFQMTFTFILGSVVVLIATWLYNQQPKPKPNILVTTTDHQLWTFNPSEKELSSPAVFVAPQVPDHSPQGTLSLSTSRSLSSSSVSLSSMSLHSSPQLEARILDNKETRTF